MGRMVVVSRWRKNKDCALVLQLSEDEGFFYCFCAPSHCSKRRRGMNNDGDDDNNLGEDT